MMRVRNAWNELAEWADRSRAEGGSHGEWMMDVEVVSFEWLRLADLVRYVHVFTQRYGLYVDSAKLSNSAKLRQSISGSAQLGRGEEPFF